MSRNQSVLAVLLAGIAFSMAGAQDSSVPNRAQGSAQSRRVPTTPSVLTPASGQSTGIPGTTVPGTRPPTTRGTTNPRREPCWQVAGVSKAAMQQRRAIALQARQEIESVCANSSLSPQQKRERIRQIREQERQQVDALITPQQQAAIRECQESRGGGHGGGVHPGGGHGAGPCGTLPGFTEHDVDPSASEPPVKN